MTKKWLILDAMGVIFIEGHDLHELLIPFIKEKNKNISVDLVYNTYIQASLGKISSFNLWSNLGFENEYPEIEEEYLDTCLRIAPDFVKIAYEFKKMYSMALLSNDVKEWSAYLREKFDLNKFFDMIIISGEVGYRKPDKIIFDILLTRINSRPNNCIFVDDNLNNLQTASELGILTIRFVRKKSKVGFCSEFEVSNFTELLGVLKNFY